MQKKKKNVLLWSRLFKPSNDNNMIYYDRVGLFSNSK